MTTGGTHTGAPRGGGAAVAVSGAEGGPARPAAGPSTPARPGPARPGSARPPTPAHPGPAPSVPPAAAGRALGAGGVRALLPVPRPPSPGPTAGCVAGRLPGGQDAQEPVPGLPAEEVLGSQHEQRRYLLPLSRGRRGGRREPGLALSRGAACHRRVSPTRDPNDPPLPHPAAALPVSPQTPPSQGWGRGTGPPPPKKNFREEGRPAEQRGVPGAGPRGDPLASPWCPPQRCSTSGAPGRRRYGSRWPSISAGTRRRAAVPPTSPPPPCRRPPSSPPSPSWSPTAWSWPLSPAPRRGRLWWAWRSLPQRSATAPAPPRQACRPPAAGAPAARRLLSASGVVDVVKSKA